MKHFRILSYITLVMMFSLFLADNTFCQDTTSFTIDETVTKTDSLQILVDQLKSSIPTSESNSKVYLWLFFSILGGVILHSIVNTLSAIKNKITTPNYFSLAYWLKENIAYKISLILGFVLTLPYCSKLSEFIIYWWGLVILILIGVVIGWFIDFLVGILQSLLKIKAALSLK